MITPLFEINQSDIFITVIIHAPFANVSMLVYYRSYYYHLYISSAGKLSFISFHITASNCTCCWCH